MANDPLVGFPPPLGAPPRFAEQPSPPEERERESVAPPEPG